MFSTWMKCQCPFKRLIAQLLNQPELRALLCHYRSPENKLHCCIHVFRVRQKAETGGHLQTKNNAQRKPSTCYSCPLTKQRMDGWIEMEWLSRVRKYGVQDPCPSSIEPLCSSSIASVHTLMREQF